MASYKRRNYQEKPYAFRDAPDSRSTILRNFLRIGIPIAIGSSVLSLINLLDNALCLKRLQSAAGFSHTEAITLYGVYGKAQMFYNLPSYFITPLILTVVPAVAGCMAQRRRDEASEIAESTLRIGAVVALPMAAGLSVLAEPIIHTLYWGSNPAGAPLLRALGPAAFFVCMALLSNAVLQAIGREQLPVLSIAVGGVVKIGVNWFLVGSPQINIFGAPVGSSCCYGVICVLDYLFLSRALKHRPRLRPGAAGAAAGLSGDGGGRLGRLRAALSAPDPGRRSGPRAHGCGPGGHGGCVLCYLRDYGQRHTGHYPG